MKRPARIAQHEQWEFALMLLFVDDFSPALKGVNTLKYTPPLCTEMLPIMRRMAVFTLLCFTNPCHYLNGFYQYLPIRQVL